MAATRGYARRGCSSLIFTNLLAQFDVCLTSHSKQAFCLCPVPAQKASELSLGGASVYTEKKMCWDLVSLTNPQKAACSASFICETRQ